MIMMIGLALCIGMKLSQSHPVYLLGVIRDWFRYVELSTLLLRNANPCQGVCVRMYVCVCARAQAHERKIAASSSRVVCLQMG